MSNALVKVAGTIANVTIWTPKEGQKGKPVLKIDLLQINDAGTHIETIKDDNLDALYTQGQHVELDCLLTSWAFDRKHGASLKVYRGNTSSIKMEVQKDPAAKAK